MNKVSIRFFDDKPIRAIWNKKDNDWYFSVYDIIGVINNEKDYNKNKNYWKYLKIKLIKNKSQLVSATIQLKLEASDGKKRLTDTLNSKDVINLAKKIPNNKAAKFLDWFLYSENSDDDKSKKKAYLLFESNLINDNEIGKTKSLQKIHAFIFGGIFTFAGQIRKRTISKGGFKFALAEYLPAVLLKIDKMPEDNFKQIVEKYVEMNIAHPFMEGNGRATRIWLDLIFKKRLKKCIDWSLIDKKQYLQAMTISHIDDKKIKSLLEHALTSKINDREMFMKGIDYSYYYEEI